MNEYTIVDVTLENLNEYPQVVCFINAKHPLHYQKMEWIAEQIQNGLQIKLLYIEGEKNPLGFIEFTPGEACWRGISADGYTVITCLWINGKKFHNHGLGQVLLNEVEKSARSTFGVAVVTSDSSFMANKSLFMKNGYEEIARDGKDQLLVKKFRDVENPRINDWRSKVEKVEPLTMFYTGQCPWVSRFIEECKDALKENNLKAAFVKLGTPREAQNGPSLNSSFALIYKGKLLADRNISVTRFKNILKKEVIGK